MGYKMAFLDNFHYQIIGSAGHPQIVFLHGLMGYGANWRKITSALQDKYQILIFDQRGHGRSHQPSSGYAPEDYANDLLNILDELGWDTIFLVGHSMGGRNALNFAFRYPQRVRALVLEDIGPEASVHNVERMTQLIEGVPTPFPSRQAAKDFFKGEFLQKFKDRPNVQGIAHYLHSNIADQADGTGDWRFSKGAILESLRLGRASDRWHELENLQVPTLLIRGAHSEELSPITYHKMLSVNSLIRGVEISDAGHWVHADQALAFSAELVRFFASVNEVD
jgi:pimeloyl-ACP methyl ester carboxylesterase